MKHVLIFAAHPDDEILGVGGAIQYYKENNYKVFVCTVTDGSSTQYQDQPEVWKMKEKEYKDAMELLGVDELTTLNFPDMKLDTISHAEVNKKMVAVVEKIQPEVIFTHYSDDLNLDHKLVYASTLVATRPIFTFLKAVYSYEVLSSTEWTKAKPFHPNHFINIEKYIEKKKQAMQIMKTELREYPHPRSSEGIEILAQYRGLQSGNKYSEAFELIKSYA